jgi:hypothetical protein
METNAFPSLKMTENAAFPIIYRYAAQACAVFSDAAREFFFSKRSMMAPAAARMPTVSPIFHAPLSTEEGIHQTAIIKATSPNGAKSFWYCFMILFISLHNVTNQTSHDRAAVMG